MQPKLPYSIDLNCDLGEFPECADQDAALLDSVTSANIACGGHAGDPQSMRVTASAALARGVAIGAHPAYPDRLNFGRLALTMNAADVERSVAEQIAALHQITRSLGTFITHVKPHGALYHAAMTDPRIAEAIAHAALRGTGVDHPRLAPMLVGLCGAPALTHWRSWGFRIAMEAFADRRYEPDGSLRSRTLKDSLIEDPMAAAEQALGIASAWEVTTSTGEVLPILAHTICIHSDTPNARAIARAVRNELARAGIRVAPLAVH